MPHFFRFFLVCSLFFPLSLAALEIPLSVTGKAEQAEEARSKAISGGERKAFYAALLQIAPKQARDIYRKFRERDIAPYIESFAVSREVQRAGYYEADVIYKVNQAAIEEFVQAEQGIFAGQQAADEPPQGDGLLIIPAYDAGGELLLWERENLWRAILNNVALEVGQGSLVMPFGDPRDIAMLEDGVVLSGDKQILANIAKRYGTRNVVIALARSRDVEGLYVVEVLLRAAGAKKGEEMATQYRAENTLESLDMVLARAARDSAEKMVASIQNFGLFGEREADKLKPLVLRLEYGSGKAWGALRKTMTTLPGFVKLDIGAVGVNAAEVVVFYRGESSMISRAFAARGYAVDTSKDYWVVSGSGR